MGSKVKKNIPWRNIYLAFCIIIFVVAAPLTVFYSFGYRFNWQTHKIYKTGILIIDSKPRGADIYLNQKLVDKKTPTRLNNLLPGEYTLRVSAVNYLPWEKKLTIYPNTATLANQLVLFQNNTKPVSIKSGQITFWQISPDQKEVIYSIENNGAQAIWLMHLDTNNEELVTTMNHQTIEAVDWSPDGNRLLLKTLENQISNWQVVDLGNPQKIYDLNTITKLEPDKVYLSQNPKIVFVVSKNDLYALDLNDQTTKLIISDLPSNYIFFQDKIYYFKQTANSMDLVSIDTNTLTTTPLVSFQTGKYQLVRVLQNRLFIWDENLKQLSLLNLNNYKVEATQKLVAPPINLEFDRSGNRVMVFNEFEIWIFNLNQQPNELITRLSTPLKQIQWLWNFEYLILTLDHSIQIIELDGRDQRNIYNIFTTQGQLGLIKTDTNERDIYFWLVGDQNLAQGIYSLTIR